MAKQKVCEDALEQYGDELSKLPNVIGLGIVPNEVGDFESEDLAIAVYIERRVPEDQLQTQDIIPKKIKILSGNVIEEVLTKVIEQGKISLESGDEETEFSVEPL